MPKVRVGTTALNNVKVQVCSQAQYANRRILIDFCGLHSLPKFGSECNSWSHCQCTHTELHSWLCSPKQEQSAQEMAQGWKIRMARAESKTWGMSRASMWTLETCGLQLLSCKSGEGFPKIRCLNLCLNISQFPGRMSSCSHPSADALFWKHWPMLPSIIWRKEVLEHSQEEGRQRRVTWCYGGILDYRVW